MKNDRHVIKNKKQDLEQYIIITFLCNLCSMNKNWKENLIFVRVILKKPYMLAVFAALSWYFFVRVNCHAQSYYVEGGGAHQVSQLILWQKIFLVGMIKLWK